MKHKPFIHPILNFTERSKAKKAQQFRLCAVEYIRRHEDRSHPASPPLLNYCLAARSLGGLQRVAI